MGAYMRHALTEKQKSFVREYLLDLNATQAAIRAGYSAKTAEVIANQLLKKTLVQAALQSAQNARAKRLNISADRVLEELARCGMYDPRKLFYPDGNPRPITELDDDTAAALVSVDVINTTNDLGETTRVMKYRLAPKEQALDKLMRHLGLFAKDNKQCSPLANLPRDVLKQIETKLSGLVGS